jgi:ATP-dependent Clp protease ATP-binding subunit ClpA
VERLNERGLDVELTSEGRDWLVNAGFDPDFGARPLQRALQKHVESPMSVSLLAGEFSAGDTIIVDVDEEQNKLIFRSVGESIPAQELEKVSTESE